MARGNNLKEDFCVTLAMKSSRLQLSGACMNWTILLLTYRYWSTGAPISVMGYAVFGRIQMIGVYRMFFLFVFLLRY